MSESKSSDSFINFIENMDRNMIIKFDSREDVKRLSKMIDDTNMEVKKCNSDKKITTQEVNENE